MMNKCFIGDCRDSMRQMIADGIRVQTCVTSPPYWGLRNYRVDGQLGLEDSPQEYVAGMVEVFSLVNKILNDDGTLWLNLGDSYYNYRPGGHERKQTIASTDQDTPISPSKRSLKSDGLKEKDLVGIPWRVAFALQDAGWYLRQDIIWAKPNVMPESVKDRCTKSHEYIFLLTKNKNYYFDNESIKEKSISGDGNLPRGSNGNSLKNSGRRIGKDGIQLESGFRAYTEMRNKRDVWFVPANSNSYESEGHFATFPEDLIIPCILAGSKAGDIVLDPFMGSGTTAKVAQNLGRKWIGCELNPDYISLQEKRTAQEGLPL